ncbi:hypothetical protein HG530_002712 [Fusarium avenaceum]|nr:hypothetical protein HG530_002712 [Fusarium avenaceum]
MAAYTQLPVSSTGVVQPDRPSSLKVGLYMVAWIVSSNITILFNKWLLDTAGFKYPILLVTWHLVFATVVTQILARTTSYLDSRHNLPNTWDFFLTTVLPIGIVSSGSLVASNFVYLYLSVAVIQMLKAASPVSVLLVSWLFGVVDPTVGKVVNILVIALGVAVASAGMIEFSVIGFVFQMCGLAFEAVRVVMTQIMLNSEGLKMDAMVGLYYYAPVVAILNLLVASFIEIPHFDMEDLHRVGFSTLFLNAAVAFTLNFTSMVLIGKTSGLVMSLSGIFKNILLVICSVLIWHVTITPIQLLGYSVTLCALIYYSVGREKLLEGLEASVNWVSGVTRGMVSRNGGSIKSRKGLWIALGAMVTFTMTHIANLSPEIILEIMKLLDLHDICTLIKTSPLFLRHFIAHRHQLLNSTGNDLRDRFLGYKSPMCLSALRLRCRQPIDAPSTISEVHEAEQTSLRLYRHRNSGLELSKSTALSLLCNARQLLIELEWIVGSYAPQAWYEMKDSEIRRPETQALVLSDTERRRFIQAAIHFETYCQIFFLHEKILFKRNASCMDISAQTEFMLQWFYKVSQSQDPLVLMVGKIDLHRKGTVETCPWQPWEADLIWQTSLQEKYVYDENNCQVFIHLLVDLVGDANVKAKFPTFFSEEVKKAGIARDSTFLIATAGMATVAAGTSLMFAPVDPGGASAAGFFIAASTTLRSTTALWTARINKGDFIKKTQAELRQRLISEQILVQ